MACLGVRKRSIGLHAKTWEANAVDATKCKVCTTAI
jgi:hypothetical protein